MRIRQASAVARGLTLVELMVSMAVGLIIVVALSAVFVASSTARQEVERSADVIENGRYAVDLLSREISQAGYLGSLATPAGNTNTLCPTGTTAAVLTAWTSSLRVAVQGLNNSASNPTCLTTRKVGTDALFVQRASTCVVGGAGCEGTQSSTFAYLQVSECGSEYSAQPVIVGAGTSNPAATFTLQTKACSSAAQAPTRRLIRRIYFVNTNDVLQSVDFGPGGAQTPVSLVDNVEQLQFEYAVDTNADGTPDSFTSTPADWTQVIGVNLWVLTRSTTPTKNNAASTTYAMGDTTYTVSAATTNLTRRVYSTYVPLNTPKLRNEN
jgi:type IV pilus assembly protein PilW